MNLLHGHGIPEGDTGGLVVLRIRLLDELRVHCLELVTFTFHSCFKIFRRGFYSTHGPQMRMSVDSFSTGSRTEQFCHLWQLVRFSLFRKCQVFPVSLTLSRKRRL